MEDVGISAGVDKVEEADDDRLPVRVAVEDAVEFIEAIESKEMRETSIGSSAGDAGA